ncbi:MAG: AAA family ATPase, partial [Legionellales bacterium]|nr:AAA family ATPase [Legionellales bacterium]
MSQQVLARKFRPHKFEDLVGQEHIVAALNNSLKNKRLHHAYLFTGTRGVGKTTLARIIAKAMSCEKDITPTPCETCSNCKQINSGCFIDLFEIDAASHTKVDETKEIITRAMYPPSQGRFRIFIIDEVHMLSKHS